MNGSLLLALVTHANAEREGARLLSAPGRAAARNAGRHLADLLESRRWPDVTVFGTAPVFRCVETLLACASQLPPAACKKDAMIVLSGLAERPGEGLSAEELLSAVGEERGGTMLVAVQGDLPSALPPELREHLNPAELELSGNVTYFVRRPVLFILSLNDSANLAAGAIEACDAFDQAGNVPSLLRPDWY